MSTEPRRRRTGVTHLASVKPDPLADAVFMDTLGIAGDLEEVLEALAPYDVNSIKALLWKKPASGLGQFAHLGNVSPPIDMATILDHLRENYGGGEYRVQIMAGGKTRKNIEFPIYGPAKALPPAEGGGLTKPGAGGDMSMGAFLQLMLAQQAEARREAADARREADDRQAKRDAAMWNTIGLVTPILAPLLLADKREKLSDVVAMLNAGKSEGGGNLKELVETLAILKGMTDPEKAAAGIDPDDLIGSIGRMAGPLANAVARRFGPRDGAADTVAPDPAAPAAPLSLPGPPAATTPVGLGAPARPSGPVDRILNLVGPDVAFLFGRGYDADEAAEIVANRIDAHGVGEAELNALVAEFLASPDWLGDLAARGVDLRPNPAWAQRFLAALIGLYQPDDGPPANSDDAHHHSGRGGRRAPDVEDDGSPGAGGEPD